MYYLGVDLGGTNIAIGLVDESGKIVHKDSVPTGRERPYQEILKDMAMLCLKVIKDAGVDQKDVKSIGVGSPGVPDTKTGSIVRNYNLNFHNTPVRTELQKYIHLPVYVENDANCAALAETISGAARGIAHSVTVTLGTGVGGGIVIDGKIYSGFNNAGSELGHMVMTMQGEQCTCGRKGCWEAYASATALIRQTKRAIEANPDCLINKLIGGDLSKVDAKVAFDAAKQGDAIGAKVVKEYITFIAEGLVNIIDILQPEAIVIGGGVCKEGDYLLKPLREYLDEHAFCKDVPQTRIAVAQMGNDAGIIGAAMLGKE